MDPPHHNQRDTSNHPNSRRNAAHLRDGTSGISGSDGPAKDPDIHAPDSGDQATDRQPQYSNGFTMIPPNESRRNKMKMMAQKEEEDLQRWKEANRAPSVHLNPEKLGGNVALAEARQKQLTDLRCTKLQKKPGCSGSGPCLPALDLSASDSPTPGFGSALPAPVRPGLDSEAAPRVPHSLFCNSLRKEELDKRRRQEEEAELQKMKTEKREMAERLEERRRQEDQRRREQHKQDHIRTNESFMQMFDRRAQGPSGSATHTSSRNEAMESKQREKESRSVRELQLEHKKVNSAFLDKLEGQGRGSKSETKWGGIQEAEDPCFAPENFKHKPSNTPGQHFSLAHLDPDPEQRCSADPEPDYDWALMKLMTSFPDCCRLFLEDILDQCNGDYKQAYTLLISTLS